MTEIGADWRGRVYKKTDRRPADPDFPNSFSQPPNKLYNADAIA